MLNRSMIEIKGLLSISFSLKLLTFLEKIMCILEQYITHSLNK